MATGADLRKFKGEQKQQVDAALAKYGARNSTRSTSWPKANVDSQFAAYDRATALGLQLKGTDSAKEAKKVVLALEADSKFKRELAAKKAYERCEKMPPGSSSSHHGPEDPRQAFRRDPLRRQGKRGGRVRRGLAAKAAK